jgi:hypothetical protein
MLLETGVVFMEVVLLQALPDGFGGERAEQKRRNQRGTELDWRFHGLRLVVD